MVQTTDVRKCEKTEMKEFMKIGAYALTRKSGRRYYRKCKCKWLTGNIGGSNLIFWKDKRWFGVGFLAVVAAGLIAPQMVKADVVIEPDGVMGQSIVDEMAYDSAEDYAWLSKRADASSALDLDQIPLFRATTYTNLFLEGSFTTVSDLNNATYYHDVTYEDCELINGVDVSWWQGGGRGSTVSKIDWKKIHEAGVDFTFVRAASRDTKDGSIYEDTVASAHIKGAQANKVNVGLYIFSQAINAKEAVEEADYVMNLIDQYDWDIDMPIIMDRESGRETKRLTDAKLSKAKETAVVQAFVDEITSAGYKAGVYASYSWYKTKMNPNDLADCTIWIARYNNTTTSNSKSGIPYDDTAYDYEFWQYSSTYKVSGYSSNIDMDFWYKDTNVKTKNVKMSKNTDTSVTLTWNDAGDAENYRVYRYNEDTGKYAYVATVNDTTYTDTNLNAGSAYQYKVRCMWTIGGTNYFGTYSSVLQAATLPAQVSGLSVDAQSATGISLSWDEAKGADGYRIFRYSSNSDSFEEVATVGADVTSYDVTGLTSASEYRFKVRASKTIGTNTYLGVHSEEAAGVTKPGKAAAPVVEAYDSNAIDLSWKKVARASGYQLYRLNEETGKYVKIATIKGASNVTYTDSELTAAKTYSYKVRAYKTYEGTDYCGAFSAVKVQVTKPEKVQNVKLTTKSSSVTVKWSKSAHVTGYEIYRLNTKTKKYEKIATVKGENKVSYTNKKLKKGTTYSYKVRAYKTHEGTDYYGSYSAVAKIKAK